MKAVNLLPEKAGGRTFTAGRGPLAAAAAVVVLGGMGWWGWSSNQAVSALREDVAAAAAERDALQQRLGVHQRSEARLALLRARRGEILGLGAGRTNWERLIRDLAGVMPRDVWLTNLKAEVGPATAAPASAAGGSAAPITAPVGLHLDGFAPDQRSVAQLMVRAAAVPGLGEPYLTTSEAQTLGDRRVVHFVIDIPVDQRAQDRTVLTPVAGPAAQVQP